MNCTLFVLKICVDSKLQSWIFVFIFIFFHLFNEIRLPFRWNITLVDYTKIVCFGSGKNLICFSFFMIQNNPNSAKKVFVLNCLQHHDFYRQTYKLFNFSFIHTKSAISILFFWYVKSYASSVRLISMQKFTRDIQEIKSLYTKRNTGFNCKDVRFTTDSKHSLNSPFFPRDSILDGTNISVKHFPTERRRRDSGWFCEVEENFQLYFPSLRFSMVRLVLCTPLDRSENVKC